MFSIDGRYPYFASEPKLLPELINVSRNTDQHNVLKHAALAVLKACDFFARADRRPDNRLPFIQRVSWIFSAKHRQTDLFGFALLFPKGGDIVICALLGMEYVNDDVLVIDEDPAVA